MWRLHSKSFNQGCMINQMRPMWTSRDEFLQTWRNFIHSCCKLNNAQIRTSSDCEIKITMESFQSMLREEGEVADVLLPYIFSSALQGRCAASPNFFFWWFVINVNKKK